MGSTKKSGAGSADKVINRPCKRSLASSEVDSASSAIASNSAKISPDKISKSKAQPRHRWQKGYQAYVKTLEEEDANNPKAKIKSERNTFKSEATVDNTSDDDSFIAHPTTGGKFLLSNAYDNNESDEEFMEEDGSDGDYEGRPASKKPLGTAGKKNKAPKKTGPPNPNGRVVGRKLVMWHRKSFHSLLPQEIPFVLIRWSVLYHWVKENRLFLCSRKHSHLSFLQQLTDREQAHE